MRTSLASSGSTAPASCSEFSGRAPIYLCTECSGAQSPPAEPHEPYNCSGKTCAASNRRNTLIYFYLYNWSSMQSVHAWLPCRTLWLHVTGRLPCRYAFFQSSLAISVVLFGFWQNEHTTFGGAVESAFSQYMALILLFLIFLLTVHTSIFLLPLVRSPL